MYRQGNQTVIVTSVCMLLSSDRLLKHPPLYFHISSWTILNHHSCILRPITLTKCDRPLCACLPFGSGRPSTSPL
uniref:Uncharacterized protein n=1 Tax=Anguilla anguilla TaxID=7936 RepID=A0A0E9WNY3_ANGAN